MLLTALAFLGGDLLLLAAPALPDPRWLAAVLLLLPLRTSRVGRVLAAVSAGFLWTWLAALHGLHHRLPVAEEGRDLRIHGYVMDLPQQQGPVLRFSMALDRVAGHVPGEGFPRRVRLSWYRSGHRLLHAGEYWSLTVRLRRPRSHVNPGSFDYAAWSLLKDSGAVGYVRRDPAPVRDVRRDCCALLRWRDRTGRWIRRVAQGFGGVLAGITVGDRRGITPAMWSVFRATGTSHLVAISGLHIGLVALLCYALAAWLWRRSARCCAWLPAADVAWLAALTAGAVYASVAGLALPTQRALVMLAALGVAHWWRSELTAMERWALALWAVLTWQPLAPLSAGFWLSFGAVAAILLAFAGYRRRTRLQAAVRLQCALTLGLLPAQAAAFGGVSRAAPLANLLVVPVFAAVVVPVALAGVLVGQIWPGAGAVMLKVDAHLLGLGWPLLVSAGHWLGRQMCPAPAPWMIGAGLAGAASLLAPRAWPARWLGAVLLLPVLLGMPHPLPATEFRLDVLDVGQGLATVVRTRHHILIYDTGPAWPGGTDAGRDEVLPFLTARGDGRPDLVVISHADLDHAGGAPSLLQAFPGVPVMTSATRRFSDAQPCEAGQHWDWDGVHFAILSPTPVTPADRNDRSCVLRIWSPAGSALLTGDIQRAAERVLLHTAEVLRSDVMVAPHHGSDSSSSTAFIAAVDPGWVLFAVGHHNRWNFPRADVQDRYQAAGARLLRTDLSGDLRVRFRQDAPPQVEGWRCMQRHWWRAVAGCAAEAP